MKKSIAIVLSLLLVIAAMGSLSASAAAEAETYSPDGSVLFEKDGLKVTTAGLDTDPTSADKEAIIWLDIENTGDREAYLGIADGSVNGVMRDLYLIDFYIEDGTYYGGDYEFQLTIPVGRGRYALGYNASLIDLGPLGEMAFCFTLAQEEYLWPDYRSAPVTIETGEKAPELDLDALGTVVVDDETMKLVIGEQDYDDFFGPQLVIYAENRTDDFLGLTADSAEADGNECDYVFFSSAVAPGKKSADLMLFDSPISDLRGFEDLKLSFSLRRGADRDALDAAESAPLEAVSVHYPPQVWGTYKVGELDLEVRPKYNDLITVETPADDPDGILFTASETVSLEEGGYEGAGWLFSIGTVSEERLREMLCRDMSGANVFAKDADGRYYMYYHPTDVRFARKNVEQMWADQEQWTMLNKWASSVPQTLCEKNDLEPVSYGNTAVDIYVARAAWLPERNATLSTLEYGPVELDGVDGTPYAESVMQGWFNFVDLSETPDGEYVELAFPDEDARVDFFYAPGAYVRVVSGETKTLYQALWYDEDRSYARIMEDWYHAAAEKAGLR